MTCFEGATLIDGKGNSFVANLLIEEDRILRILKDEECPKDVETIDCKGKYILPGLINSHVHICADPTKDFGDRPAFSDAKRAFIGLKNLQSHLRAGITFVRDLGGYNFVELELRDAIKNGDFQGAEMIGAGQCITMTGGHGWTHGREVDGVDEARKAAREQFKAAADLIKVMATGGVMTPGVEPGASQLCQEEMAAAIEEAKKRGAKSATHAQGTQGIKNAILAGVDSIEHGIFLDDEVISMTEERGVVLVPTLMAPYYIEQLGEEAEIPSYAVDKAKSIQEAHEESFRKSV